MSFNVVDRARLLRDSERSGGSLIAVFRGAQVLQQPTTDRRGGGDQPSEQKQIIYLVLFVFCSQNQYSHKTKTNGYNEDVKYLIHFQQYLWEE